MYSATLAGLPAEQTRLIGRDDDCRTVCELLRQARLVSVLGTGGLGKTRVAVAVTRMLGSTFADGVQFIDLSDLTNPELLPETLMTSLGLGRERGSSLEKLKRYLSTKHLLLTLDNFEQIVGAAPLLAELLSACPKLHLLVTSRIPLRLRWEQRYPLTPLALPEHEATLERVQASPAATLFTERVNQVMPGFTIDDSNYLAVATLCRRLDGLPLALELAAARTTLFSLEGLIRYLNGKNDLPGQPEHDRPERHHSLEHAIKASFDLLTPSQQTLFCQLGVFAGTFDDAAVAAISEHTNVTERLLELSEHNLLKVVRGSAEVRFRLLETLRAFALRHQNEAEALATKTRHAHYYFKFVADVTEQHGATSAASLGQLDGAFDNIRLALDFLLSSPEHALTGAELTHRLRNYFLARGLLGEAQSYFTRALAHDPPENLRAWLTNGLAGLALEQAELEKAAQLLGVSYTLAQRFPQDWLLAACANDLGLVAKKQGNLSKARTYFVEAIAAYEAAGRTSVSPRINLGNLLLEDGAFAAAAEHFEKLLVCAEQDEQTSQYAMLRILHNLGNARRLNGDLDLAKHYLCEALGVAKALEDYGSQARLLGLLSDVALRQKHLHEAGEFLLEALAHKPPEHNPVLNVELLYFLTRFGVATNNIEGAATLQGAYLAAQHSLGVALGDIDKQLNRALEQSLQIVEERQRQLLAAMGAGRSVAENMAFGKQMLETLMNQDHSSSTTTLRVKRELLISGLATMNLSSRELQMLEYLAKGHTNKAIAKELGLSPNTIKHHINALFNKLSVNNRAQAVAKAAELGFF